MRSLPCVLRAFFAVPAKGLAVKILNRKVRNRRRNERKEFEYQF